ncbi:PQQ-binding-like beta-propeller repeat protein [Rhodopirellula sp. MGV]|uniref:PQQ-binding-like beta-propeller repeat protein n=1 Tax=Rhodopirellula sp. MGV TaxID=2023130 RepID=UPI000B96A5B2|nr:PQQ-binding-like beta-propeller repeat protein [Rhodopirellula sp. MGV]OYP29517.1 serine/threonine protein kinase [Rhodopirellula sp. MGV]PNY35292.1 serine/threonine protein kinase [Rhodopirellula baltica]
MKKRDLVLALVFACTAKFAVAEDWPQWHGPNRDAMSKETGLLQQWPSDGPALAWKVEGIGTGYSAPSVVAGKMFGLSNRGEDEVVWALSESDGKELWVTKLAPALTEGMPQGIEGGGCTPTVEGDHMYVIGAGGTIACLQVADGKIVWQRSLQDDFGGILPTWRYNESPLVQGDLVYCTPGGPNATMAALNKKTGETVWTNQLIAESGEAAPERSEGRRGGGRGRGRSGPRSGAGYASPILIEAAGKPQVVQLTAKAMVGVDPTSGESLWQYDAPANPMGINCSTPIYKDGLVFGASAYGNGGGAVELQKSDDGEITAEEVYFTPKMQNHHGGMIAVDGALYGANGGNGGGVLTCLDFHTGDVFWQDRAAQKGALLFADQRLYLRTEDGTLILIEPNKDEFVERGRFEQPDRTKSPAWTHPVIANGKLYIRDQDTLYCYDIKAKS